MGVLKGILALDLKVPSPYGARQVSLGWVISGVSTGASLGSRQG